MNLDRLACWQTHVDTDRHTNTDQAEATYKQAVVSLWPQLADSAPTVAKDLKPDRLLSHPRDTWATVAAQIVLDAVVNDQRYVVRPLAGSWNLTRTEMFSVEALLSEARIPTGVQITTPDFHT